MLENCLIKRNALTLMLVGGCAPDTFEIPTLICITETRLLIVKYSVNTIMSVHMTKTTTVLIIIKLNSLLQLDIS